MSNQSPSPSVLVEPVRAARDDGHVASLLPGKRPLSAGVALAALLFLCAHAVLIVAAGRATGATVDEGNYFNCGHLILEHGWVHEATVFQGPVPLYANQLFVGDYPSGGYDGRKTPHEVLERGRLGTLPFALLSATLVFVWARRLFGDAGGLLALLLHALNPLMVGFGSLLLVDAQHASLALSTLFLLWLWVETRSPWYLPGIGIALGLSLATKYLALFLIPTVALSLVVVSAFHARGFLLRTRAALVSTAVVALCSLTTLHAAYRFREPFASFELGATVSDLMQRVLDTPVLGQLVQVLPAPFLRGVNFQLFQSQRLWNTYLNGEVAPSHDSYYLWTMLCKTPELVLLGAVLLLVLVLPRLFRKGADPRWRSAAVLTFSYVLVCVGYLSLFTEMQLGIRYIVPIYPVLFLWLGALVFRLRPGQPAFVALCTLALGLHALDLRRSWPDLIAYYNASAGGQERGYLRFRDTNSDFGQYEFTAVPILRERFPDVRFLGPESGARFGRLAIHTGALRPDIERWLTIHPQLDHLGASTYVFEVTPEEFERQVEAGADPALRRDLCVAYLGAGRREDARRHLAQLEPALAAPLEALIAKLDAVQQAPTREHLEALILAWSELGRLDLAEGLALEHPAVLRDSREAAVARVRACAERLDFAGAAAVFDEFEFAPDDLIRMRLVAYLRSLTRYDEAREVFDELQRSLGPKWADSPPIRRLDSELEQHQRYMELLR